MRFSRISVLIPTRQRIARLTTMLESYEATTMGCSSASEVIFRVDEDDIETQDYLEFRGKRMVIGPRFEGYGSMPVFFNQLADVAIGDIYLSGNDDMIFRTPHWAEMLLATANRFPDGIFNLGTTTMNADHYPWCMISRHAAEMMGFYWDPRIFWGDIFLRDVMMELGRCIMVPEVVIDHDWAGNQPDHVFMETRESKSRIEADSLYWNSTHRPAVHEAVERLKGLVVA